MMGVVTDRGEPVIPIRLFPSATSGQAIGLTACIDTGFTAEVTLPQETLDAAGFHLINSIEVFVANGESVEMSLYEGWIEWSASGDRLKFSAEVRTSSCWAQASSLSGGYSSTSRRAS